MTMCKLKQLIVLRYCPRLIRGLFAAFMLAMFSVSSTARDFSPESNAKELVVAVPALFPPQYQVDKQGQPQGFAIDIMDEVARRANLRLAYRVEEHWPEVFDALRKGHADLIPNLGITESRKKDFIFTQPVETTAIGIIVRSASSDIHSIEDLIGRRVATVQGNISVGLLTPYQGIDLLITDEIEDALFALLSADVDAIVYPIPWINHIARRAGLDQHIKSVGEPLYEVKRAIAVHKKDAALLVRLNSVLDTFMGTEQYRQIYQKWYGSPQYFWTTQRVALALFSVVLCIVMVMGVWHYLSVLSINRRLAGSLKRRKQAEETLRENERQLQGLMYHSSAIIFIKDLEGRYLLVNRRFNEVANLGKDTGVGKTDYDLFPKKIADSFRASDLAVLKSRRVQEFEETVPSEHGDSVYLIVKYCLYDEQGEPYALCGMATDITKRVLAEQRLRQSEKRYRQLVETLSDEYFFYFQTPDSDFSYLSPSVYNILGYTEDEFKEQWKSFVTDSPLNIRAAEKHKKILCGEQVPSYEVEMFHKNGQRRRLEIFATPLKNDNGELSALEGIVHDITSRTEEGEKLQRQEHELRQILDSLIDGVIAINEKGRVQSFNRAAEKMFGYSSVEIIGKNINILMPEIDSNRHDNYLRNFVETSIGKFSGVERVVVAQRCNGETFPMRLSVAELPLQKDKLRRFIGSCVDITDQQQQETQLRHSSKMDALGKLTGGIAHDYNNMLGVILGYSEILEDSMGDEKLKKYVKEIHRAGERGAKLTRRLLSFSRRQMAEADAVDVNAVLKDIQLMLEKSIMSRISLSYELESDVWLIWVDQGDLEDAILNISINAMHAIPKEGGLVIKTCNSRLSDHEANLLGISAGDYVLLSIIDSGSGMDKETQSKIFDPFFTTKGDKGTGLGLSQVYGFMQQAGGVVNAQSQINKGTSFNLYFPRYISYDPLKYDAKDVELSTMEGQKTILIVDDEDALRRLTMDFLKRGGYQVIDVNSAEKALNVLRDESVDLVLSDIIMASGMDGYQLADEIKHQFPRILIQLMSGFTGEKKSAYFNEDLHEKIISKPFSSKDLMYRIDELLSEEAK